MDTIREAGGRIEFSSEMPLVARLLILAAGLVPLLAPYELLIKPIWQEFSLVWVFALLISAGAIATSLLAICVAIFGMSQHIQFDPASHCLTYSFKTAGGRHGEKQYPFSDIETFRVRTHHWSEGPATYNLALKLRATREIEFGRFVVQQDAERYLSVLSGMIER
jgi:hypothetical protein